MFNAVSQRRRRTTTVVMGSGSGSVGRALTSDTRGPQFESGHWPNFWWTFIANCIEQTKIKKEAVNGPFKNTKCSNYYKALGPFKNQLWWLLLGLSWLLAADENGSKRRSSWVLRLCSILSEQCDASPLTVGRRRGKQHRESSEHRLG